MASDGRPYRGSVLSSAAARLGAFHTLRVASPSRMTTSHRRVDAPFRQSLIGTFYSSGYKGRMKRRGTFTRQCCQSLSAGETAIHVHVLRGVTELHHRVESIPGFSCSRNVAHRDQRNATPPRSILTCPLRRRQLPVDHGSYRSMRVRVRISESARTSPGRISQIFLSSKIAPFL